MTEVTLNASMRNNLLSLQQTQRLQDRTQLRLSTGLKVNSAIDNPSSYYTATSLNNRASDLSALLDTMSQGIQTIKAANEVLETGTSILQQAKAVAVKASEAATAYSVNYPDNVIAMVHNESELLAAIEKGEKGYIVIENDITFSENTQIQLKDGQSLVSASHFNNNLPKTKLIFKAKEANPKSNIRDDMAEEMISYSRRAGDNGAGLAISVAKRCGIVLANDSLISGFEIEIEDTSFALNHSLIYVKDAQNVVIGDIDINGAALSFENSDALIQGNLNIHGFSGEGISIVHSNVCIADNSKINISLNEKKTDKMIRTSLGIIIDEASLLDINNSEVNISVRTVAIQLASSSSVSDLDNPTLNINNSKLNIFAEDSGLRIFLGYTANIIDSEVNILSGSRFSAIEAGGKLNINSGSKLFLATTNTDNVIMTNNDNLTIDSGAKIAIKSGETTSFFDAMAFQSALDSGDILRLSADNFVSETGATVNTTGWAVPDWNKIADEISSPKRSEGTKEENKTYKNPPDSKGFAEIISQYDMLINDASYKGVNLLQNNDLKINFNEDRTSKIEVKGVDASSEGLGIRSIKWNSQVDILNSVEELESAINQLRSFSAELGNYYAIVTTREDFTENLINVLTEGADKLTLADMNAESANMLALQTRQQLAINSLSLASQATQSVLKLF